MLKLQAKATVIFAWAPRDLFAANTNSRVGYNSAAIGLFQTRFVQIQIGSARNHNTPPNLKQNQKRELVWFVWFVWFVRDAKWNGRHGRNDNSLLACLWGWWGVTQLSALPVVGSLLTWLGQSKSW